MNVYDKTCWRINLNNQKKITAYKLIYWQPVKNDRYRPFS